MDVMKRQGNKLEKVKIHLRYKTHFTYSGIVQNIEIDKALPWKMLVKGVKNVLF